MYDRMITDMTKEVSKDALSDEEDGISYQMADYVSSTEVFLPVVEGRLT